MYMHISNFKEFVLLKFGNVLLAAFLKIFGTQALPNVLLTLTP